MQHGSRFDDPGVVAPYKLVVGPADAEITADNMEIVRVDALTGAVMTLARAQNGTGAREIKVGDLIFQAPLKEWFDSLKADIASKAWGEAGQRVASEQTLSYETAKGASATTVLPYEVLDCDSAFVVLPIDTGRRRLVAAGPYHVKLIGGETSVKLLGTGTKLSG